MILLWQHLYNLLFVIWKQTVIWIVKKTILNGPFNFFCSFCTIDLLQYLFPNIWLNMYSTYVCTYLLPCYWTVKIICILQNLRFFKKKISPFSNMPQTAKNVVCVSLINSATYFITTWIQIDIQLSGIHHWKAYVFIYLYVDVYISIFSKNGILIISVIYANIIYYVLLFVSSIIFTNNCIQFSDISMQFF